MASECWTWRGNSEFSQTFNLRNHRWRLIWMFNDVLEFWLVPSPLWSWEIWERRWSKWRDPVSQRLSSSLTLFHVLRCRNCDGVCVCFREQEQVTTPDRGALRSSAQRVCISSASTATRKYVCVYVLGNVSQSTRRPEVSPHFCHDCRLSSGTKIWYLRETSRFMFSMFADCFSSAFVCRLSHTHFAGDKKHKSTRLVLQHPVSKQSLIMILFFVWS